MSDSPTDSVPRATAIIVAAGRSTRMGVTAEDGLRKPFFQIAGRTVLETTCAAFDRATAIDAIVLVGHADDLDRLRALAETSKAFAKVAAVVPGGAERTDSVRLGVEAAPTAELVAVHDAARALIDPKTIDAAVRTASEHDAALVALPVNDTIKRSGDGRSAAETLDRSELFAAQTPQVFRARKLLELLQRAADEGWKPTDDSSLWERYVGPVPLVEGSPHNLKITTRADLAIAEAILHDRARA